MSISTPQPLPDYELPPVREVVCGLQFEPLEGFNATTFGLLWQRFRGEYPTCEQQPPLAQTIERFGTEMAAGEPQFELTSTMPLPRMFFVQQNPSWLLQVQNDRLLHNWRKQEETDVYPRFPKVFEKFWSAWGEFLKLCGEEEIGTPQLNQLEVTYINHIVAGEGWDSTSTVGRVFPDIAWREQRAFLPPPESGVWKASFILPEKCGRLHVSVRHAVRRTDLQPVLLCELTARGIPKTHDDDAIREWFLLGREWIVRGFADLTDEQVQDTVWKRKKV